MFGTKISVFFWKYKIPCNLTTVPIYSYLLNFYKKVQPSAYICTVWDVVMFYFSGYS